MTAGRDRITTGRPLLAQFWHVQRQVPRLCGGSGGE
jgi:hypothetical protein